MGINVGRRRFASSTVKKILVMNAPRLSIVNLSLDREGEQP